MSSSDIFDVLNIKQKSRSPTNGQVSVPSSSAANRPKPQVTGMQRELFNLLGENQPPVVIKSGNNFKEKMLSTSKPSPWSFVEFKANSSVTLRHWVKGSKELIGDTPKESPYSKFNQHLSIPSFTKEEYEAFMNENEGTQKSVESEKNHNENFTNEKKDESKNSWSFEEIEYLFNLCKKYDLRWFLIFDRYSYNNSRTLEDLKEKFYYTCRNYFKASDPSNPLLSSLNFSAEKEIERKKYLQRLLSRSAAEIAEEEALVVESKKFEMAAKRTLAERESLLRLLDSPHSDQTITQYLTSQGMSQLYNALLADKTRKRKHDSNIPENPWMKQQQQFAQHRQLQQLNVKKSEVKENLSPKKTKRQRQEMQTALKRKSESAYAEQLLKDFNSDERKALGVITHGEKLSPGVYLRSTKLSTFKPALQNKILAILQELSLPSRPVMPSFDVMERQEELLKKINTLIDLKKHVDKYEAARHFLLMPSLPLKNSKERNNNIKKPFKSFTTKRMKTSKRKKKEEGMKLFKEDWQLSQFWYSDDTAAILADAILEGADENTVIAIVSAPSVYAAIQKKPTNEIPTEHIYLFEFDKRFELLAGRDHFFFYDYNKPLDFNDEIKGKVDRLLIDPPFLNEDCQTKSSITAKCLLAPNDNSKTKKGVFKHRLISCTGERMSEVISKVYSDTRITTFLPEHSNGLSNEFRCYANFECSSWKFAS
ncbi:ALH_1b_G0020380.mRNA.1.CDS.1 [Saccharomyces cerevisiae]|nr:ALH_1c_G0020330.mRNA.1.CDS.1 [Saccharomyces cerevisiae]CAI4494901.1 ALH_1b_G0020380.mRNA.1.CDS.1 [Saccharomyces cerevisiae]CAI6673430.1 ALH_1b_G0020380.mRNA.1.CDS.1 [Saccharomyces cerevisiae]CAI6673788.1 ALH_1c_G0020330.mRNA.1.CDS.1 [Saccharomyces cerevisiae]